MLLCLGLLLALCLAGIVVAMLCLHRSVNHLTRVTAYHQIQSMRSELASGAVDIHSNMVAFLDGRRQGNPGLAEHNFEEALDECASCHHEPEVEASLLAIREDYLAFRDAAEDLEVRDSARPHRLRRPARRDALEHRLEALAQHLARHTTELAEQAEQHVAYRSAHAEASIRNAWLVLIGTSLGALLIGGFVAFHLHHRLTQPISHLLKGIEHSRDGDPAGHFSFQADTEFRALADAFEDAYKTLDTARGRMIKAEKLAATGRLAAGIAHEIGNPLASISAAAQVMGREHKAERDRRQVELIMQEIARISRVIRELLTVSRPSMEAAHVSVDIHALLDRTTSLIQHDRRGKNVQLVCQYEQVPTVTGDPDQLLVVFTNIILNAFDAVSTRGDSRGLLTITSNREGEQVVVRFEDNGTGMNEEQMAKAFEPFFTTKEPGVGTGLGLWTSYRVVQQHNGSIDLQSRPGTGTTVTVRLPCQQS
jgi:signal transduction histidine kinase